MNTTVTLQVRTDAPTHRKLRRRGGPQDISEAITKTIECWLEDPSRFAPGADPEDMHGYQWKSLFLPAGTVLKSWSYGENNYELGTGSLWPISAVRRSIARCHIEKLRAVRPAPVAPK